MQHPQKGAAAENIFDLLRLAFASLVILSHSYGIARGTDDPVQRITGGRCSLGSFAVGAFFAISGLLVSQSWTRSRGPLDYARRRALRIYPGWIVSALVTALVIVPIADGDWAPLRGFCWRRFAEYTTLFVSYTPPAFAHNPTPNVVNASVWTIRHEAWCYVLVSALGAAGLIRRRWAVPALYAAVLAAFVWLAIAGVPRWLHLPATAELVFGYADRWPRLAADFLAGVVFGRDGRTPGRRTLGLWALLLTVCIGACLWSPLPLELAEPTAWACLVLCAGSAPAVLPRFGWHVDLSYGLYLYAFPIQQLLAQWFPALPPLGLFAVAWAATAAVAGVSWFLVERPALRLKGGRRHRLSESPSSAPRSG